MMAEQYYNVGPYTVLPGIADALKAGRIVFPGDYDAERERSRLRGEVLGKESESQIRSEVGSGAFYRDPHQFTLGVAYADLFPEFTASGPASNDHTDPNQATQPSTGNVPWTADGTGATAPNDAAQKPAQSSPWAGLLLVGGVVVLAIALLR